MVTPNKERHGRNFTQNGLPLGRQRDGRQIEVTRTPHLSELRGYPLNLVDSHDDHPHATNAGFKEFRTTGRIDSLKAGFTAATGCGFVGSMALLGGLHKPAAITLMAFASIASYFYVSHNNEKAMNLTRFTYNSPEHSGYRNGAQLGAVLATLSWLASAAFTPGVGIFSAMGISLAWVIAKRFARR